MRNTQAKNTEQDEEPAGKTYISADELLAAASKAQPHVDLDLGGAFIRVKLAPSYDDMLDLDRKREEWLKRVKESSAGDPLRKYRGLSDESIKAAALIHLTCENPALSMDQALKLTEDGLTIKVLMAGIQAASISHLTETALARIEAEKKDSSEIQSSD